MEILSISFLSRKASLFQGIYLIIYEILKFFFHIFFLLLPLRRTISADYTCIFFLIIKDSENNTRCCFLNMQLRITANIFLILLSIEHIEIKVKKIKVQLL